jgi:hypothetical protein
VQAEVEYDREVRRFSTKFTLLAAFWLQRRSLYSDWEPLAGEGLAVILAYLL